MESIKDMGWEIEEVLFQQDNAPAHVSLSTRRKFQEVGLQVLDWAAQSPDLNPIEHLWGYLKKKVGDHPRPANVEALWELVQDEWLKVPPSFTRALVASLPQRLEAVIKARGGYTKY